MEHGLVRDGMICEHLFRGRLVVACPGAGLRVSYFRSRIVMMNGRNELALTPEKFEVQTVMVSVISFGTLLGAVGAYEATHFVHRCVTAAITTPWHRVPPSCVTDWLVGWLVFACRNILKRISFLEP